MSNQVDDWHRLASYDTNIQGEIHANLLKNNDINVSVQALSAIPGMNSGATLWVRAEDLDKAKQILNNIDSGSDDADTTSNGINK
ncbi:hypothetical protein [Psychrobacter sp. FDAARGOS_221]|uniref:hypothetical protein n=1 Tax=Psychrobacter sp. FDAARGOS_221 TaxID=1975705 RepID=UPI000BB56833|nr:hypothetical protein [Psychrobacter sp. FDAARGOS_221]PNK60858.1 hypothetical protein A6J60_008180 [Psychrobacter sp. FDAARGOS_221]